MTTPASEPDLTFQWPARSGFSYLLLFCVIGSLLAHGATFILFQVVYPQRVTIPQPAPHVSLLTPSSPENIAILRWIEAEDPALIATDNAVTPPTLAQVQYVPSFAEPRTPPLGAPEEPPHEVRFPPAVDRLTAIARSATDAPPVPVPEVTTQLSFSGALRSRELKDGHVIDAMGVVAEPVIPTVYLLGVNGEGVVRYQFLQQSSGNPALDQRADLCLRRLTFAPSDAPITWAPATFAWGAEVYARESLGTGKPTPRPQ